MTKVHSFTRQFLQDTLDLMTRNGIERIIMEGKDDLFQPVVVEVPGTVSANQARRAAAIQRDCKPLVEMPANIKRLPNYLNSDKRLANLPIQFSGLTLPLVGTSYVARKDVATWLVGNQSVGKMALIVREVDNPVDPFSLPIFMWDVADKSWVHVGWVPQRMSRDVHAKLRMCGANAVLKGSFGGMGQGIRPTELWMMDRSVEDYMR